MNGRIGTRTDYLSHTPSRLAATVAAGKLARLFSMPSIEFLVVAITAPILVVLVVWLGIALGLPLVLSLGVATILGLALVTPYMLRAMRSFTPTETDDILFMSPMLRAAVVSNFSKDPGYKGWSGQMVNLTSDELELLSELLGEYLEDNDDLSQREWGFAKGVLDKIEEALDA